MDNETKRWIDNASYYQLLSKNRFGKMDDPIFQGDLGEHFIHTLTKKRNELTSDEQVKISKWNPIETVPKDGREVILKVKIRAGIPGKCLIGHFMPGGHCIEDHPPIEAGWYFWNGYMFDKAAEPIEWMPLPNN